MFAEIVPKAKTKLRLKNMNPNFQSLIVLMLVFQKRLLTLLINPEYIGDYWL